MISFLKGLAYLLVYTTPIAIGFLLWILVVIFTTDYTLINLSTNDFVGEKFPWFKDWIYSWFWNAWLNFWWKFPIFIIGFLKTVANYLIGIWLMNKVVKIENA